MSDDSNADRAAVLVPRGLAYEGRGALCSGEVPLLLEDLGGRRSGLPRIAETPGGCEHLGEGEANLALDVERICALGPLLKIT